MTEKTNFPSPTFRTNVLVLNIYKYLVMDSTEVYRVDICMYTGNDIPRKTKTTYR